VHIQSGPKVHTLQNTLHSVTVQCINLRTRHQNGEDVTTLLDISHDFIKLSRWMSVNRCNKF